MGIAAIINGEYLPTHAWFCGFIDIFFVGGTYLSTWYVALMSLERSLLIIHNIHLATWLWISIMIFELVMFLIFNIISISLNQISLADLAVYCMTTPDFHIGYITNTTYFVMMCLCLLAVLYSYLGIAAIQRKRAWKDIRDLNMSKDEALKQANKVIGKVFFLLFIYMACNFTEILNTVYELITGETRSSVADFASTVMLTINPVANCIILIQLHDPIKVSLLKTYPTLSKILGNKNAESVQT
ncbi:hypothetical protein CONCODRAFT_13489 [Conidiobolus coronatus NRRL 28638]|uniref:G-protein coupled receptors family 1 profile domain-containing protein n=1 Tax=Conidiobolus coronatus (strain ATCC 28846 / CBS 209.66 / NRRL 28638) TaxID=796925 RepID=A0A137NQM4_CONC2|nr:hypothetical protein CONCODRAFT_13489 [Conidiobolus coronatus NRRL 28638]|eukprot:KXN65059.1 hypothetical protein CONCODRAFT_13489 [Conidiobolus coronatus NRRL 28638]